MVRNFLPVRQPQEIAERERIRATPRDAPLAVDPLEVADHVHPEIPPRRKRRRAHPRRVIRLAHPFNERVEPGFPKQVLQAIVERVSRRARHLRPPRHQIALNRLRSPHRHRSFPPCLDDNTESAELDFVNGLLRARGIAQRTFLFLTWHTSRMTGALPGYEVTS